MPFLELFDETLDINSTDNYELSLQMSQDDLSFCILDSIRNKYVLIRSFEPEENKYFNAGEIEDFIKKDDFLGRTFRKTRLVTPGPKSTLVPSPLYDPARSDDYFTLNYTKNDNEEILSNKIDDPDSYLLFTSQISNNEVIRALFPGVQQYHHLIPLLRHISGEMKKSGGHYIHVHVEREYFNLLIFDHNSLLLCNSYMYRDTSDILYYVMNAFKKMVIKNEETIHFSGLTRKLSDLSSGFLTYVRNISFAVPSGNFTFSYVFSEIDLHRYINLLTLANCE